MVCQGDYCRWNSFSSLHQSSEAAKVIENSQRDINIAFVNELSKILISWILTPMPSLAASTKWNFPFTPGLVGAIASVLTPIILLKRLKKWLSP